MPSLGLQCVDLLVAAGDRFLEGGYGDLVLLPFLCGDLEQVGEPLHFVTGRVVLPQCGKELLVHDGEQVVALKAAPDPGNSG